MNTRELIERVRGAGELLVAMNIDGTITRSSDPMSPRPSGRSGEPRWLAGAEDALIALDRAPGIALALITGGTYGRLIERTRRLHRLWRIAEHGAVIGMPGGGCLVAPPAPALEMLQSLAG